MRFIRESRVGIIFSDPETEFRKPDYLTTRVASSRLNINYDTNGKSKQHLSWITTPRWFSNPYSIKKSAWGPDPETESANGIRRLSQLRAPRGISRAVRDGFSIKAYPLRNSNAVDEFNEARLTEVAREVALGFVHTPPYIRPSSQNTWTSDQDADKWHTHLASRFNLNRAGRSKGNVDFGDYQCLEITVTDGRRSLRLTTFIPATITNRIMKTYDCLGLPADGG